MQFSEAILKSLLHTILPFVIDVKPLPCPFLTRPTEPVIFFIVSLTVRYGSTCTSLLSCTPTYYGLPALFPTPTCLELQIYKPLLFTDLVFKQPCKTAGSLFSLALQLLHCKQPETPYTSSVCDPSFTWRRWFMKTSVIEVWGFHTQWRWTVFTHLRPGKSPAPHQTSHWAHQQTLNDIEWGKRGRIKYIKNKINRYRL